MEQRKRTEYRYTLAAQGANDGLWDWDVESGRVYYSPRWKAMLGYGESEIGDGLDEWLDRVHADDLPRLRADIDAHLRHENENLSSEFRDPPPRRPVPLGALPRASPSRTPSATPCGPPARSPNITDRKLAEEQLRFEAMHDSLRAWRTAACWRTA